MANLYGLFTGLDYSHYPIYNENVSVSLDQVLNDIVSSGAQNNIVGITMFPRSFFQADESGQTMDPDTGEFPRPLYVTKTVSRPASLNGYVPKNKKLLTFPYVYLNVDCLNANHIYKFEEFYSDPDTASFKVYGIVSANPEFCLVPLNYDHIAENITQALYMTGFPQCAFVIDSYRAWLAQKATGTVLSLAGTVAGAVVGGAVGAGVGITSGLNVAKNINDAHIEATQNTRVRGNDSGSIDVATRKKAFYFCTMTLKAQNAQIIDQFFDRYGYTCEKVKVPNRNVRPHWCYTKTKNVTITGNVPADDLEKIKQIYNNGITFWKNASEVGNYTLDNSVE